MHPTIISIGDFAIRSYGFMLAIGFLTGILLAAWRAKRTPGADPDRVYDLSVWIVLSSLFGARVYYVVTHWSEFRAPAGLSLPMRLFVELKAMFWPVGGDGQVGLSGLVLYGGLICATLTVVAYMRLHRMKVFMYTDIIAPSLGLGEFFTRIGCFLNGCCYGHPTSCPWGVVFPEDSMAGFYFAGVPLHPAQLYNSFWGLAICLLIILFERYRKFYGFSSLVYFILYSAGRFTIDFTRQYESDLVWFGLSHNQILSLFIFVAASAALAVMTVRTRHRTFPGQA